MQKTSTEALHGFGLRQLPCAFFSCRSRVAEAPEDCRSPRRRRDTGNGKTIFNDDRNQPGDAVAILCPPLASLNEVAAQRSGRLAARLEQRTERGRSTSAALGNGKTLRDFKLRSAFGGAATSGRLRSRMCRSGVQRSDLPFTLTAEFRTELWRAWRGGAATKGPRHSGTARIDRRMNQKEAVETTDEHRWTQMKRSCVSRAVHPVNGFLQPNPCASVSICGFRSYP